MKKHKQPRVRRPKEIKYAIFKGGLICLGEDDGWFMCTKAEAKRLHAWLGRAIQYLEQEKK
jgi:hypothetical protein